MVYDILTEIYISVIHIVATPTPGSPQAENPAISITESMHLPISQVDSPPPVIEFEPIGLSAVLAVQAALLYLSLVAPCELLHIRSFLDHPISRRHATPAKLTTRGKSRQARNERMPPPARRSQSQKLPASAGLLILKNSSEE